MSRKSFWSGVATGAAGTFTGLWALGILTPLTGTLQHIERSIQIGCTPEEVFSALARVERMPQIIRSVVRVASCEDVSAWIAQIDGRQFEWDLEIVQVIPKQVVGWKSYQGPKHWGQVSLFPIGENTFVHVEVTYALPNRFARIFGSPTLYNLGDALEGALLDLKSTLEIGRKRTAVTPISVSSPLREQEEQANGTFGATRGPRSLTRLRAEPLNDLQLNDLQSGAQSGAQSGDEP